MKKDNKFLQWLKRPHGVFLVLIYLLTAAAIAGAVVSVIFVRHDTPLQIAAYCLYGLSAVLLAYTVYTVVIYAGTVKRKVIALLKRNKFFANVLENYGFKTVLFSLVSFGITVAFAVMNIVSAVRYRLVWYWAIAAYYAVLIVFRGGVLLADRIRKKKCGGDERKYEADRWKIYLSGGICLIPLELAMAAAITQLMLSGKPMRSGMVMAIANAAYTFFKMGMAIYNLFKARKFDNPIVQALRNLNLADACMAVVSLTVLMISTFDDGTSGDSMLYIKSAVGFVACAVIIIMAVAMIVSASKKLKNRSQTTACEDPSDSDS